MALLTAFSPHTVQYQHPSIIIYFASLRKTHAKLGTILLCHIQNYMIASAFPLTFTPTGFRRLAMSSEQPW